MKEKRYIPDSRFKSISREAKSVSIAWIIYFVLMMVVCYVFGGSAPTEYQYLLGFPVWFTLCIALTVLFAAISVFMLLKVMKAHPLDADDPNYEYAEGGKK